MELWVTEYYKDTGLSLKVRDTLYHHVSPFQTIDVVESEAYGRLLLLDGTISTTERDEFVSHEMITHIPMGSHPNPREILILGGGDGGALREVLKHACVERVVVCEIDRSIVEASQKYLPTLGSSLNHPRAEVHFQDGIDYMAQHQGTFDIILIDSHGLNTKGSRQGAFEDTFYESVKQALKAGGIMATQTESPFASPSSFQAVYKRLRHIFPVVTPYFGSIPTYPSGLWSWCFANTEGFGPFTSIDDARMAEIEQTCQYYNRQIHRAAFTMPNFVRRLLSGTESSTRC